MPSRSKYGNKITHVDGVRFDSAKEAKRYKELKLLEKSGSIKDIELQPVFKFDGVIIQGPKRNNTLSYRADFRYKEKHNNEWREVVEDVKGHQTREFKIKRALMKKFFDIDIILT